MDALWKAIGFSCYFLDKVYDTILRGRPDTLKVFDTDKTGRLCTKPAAFKASADGADVILVNYPGQLAHSLWRSQELTLFHRYRDWLKRPRADFGCGDGSFSALLFDRIDYGIDPDETALRAAQDHGIYDCLLCCRGESIPLQHCSVSSIFSNSVLEHVDSPDCVLKELHKILIRSGILMFTVPVTAFAQSVAAYFGQEESDTINRCFHHRNLHPAQWWDRVLRRSGFEVLELRHYQPAWFTFSYVVFSTRVFQRLQNVRLLERLFYPRIVQMVRNSIAQSSDGDNIFVIARRT